jgi:hypothetical protein
LQASLTDLLDSGLLTGLLIAGKDYLAEVALPENTLDFVLMKEHSH